MKNPLVLVLIGVGVLIVIGLVAGSVLDSKGVHELKNPPGPDVTVSQYGALKAGATQQDVIAQLQENGLAEQAVQAKYVALFPPHSDDVTCRYWYVTERYGVLARLCFSSPGGVLTEKLQRDTGV